MAHTLFYISSPSHYYSTSPRLPFAFMFPTLHFTCICLPHLSILPLQLQKRFTIIMCTSPSFQPSPFTHGLQSHLNCSYVFLSRQVDVSSVPLRPCCLILPLIAFHHPVARNFHYPDIEHRRPPFTYGECSDTYHTTTSPSTP